jgi:parallel beta-helix repeat protein
MPFWHCRVVSEFAAASGVIMGHLRKSPIHLSSFFRVSVVLCLAAAAAGQTTIHVPADQPTIQAGINAATNGDTVLVSPGSYNENIDFKGKAITVTSGASQFSDAAATIINGTTDGFVVSFVTNEPPAAVFNGFTVQGGHSSAVTKTYTGGISISGSSPTVTNNVITNNAGCGVLIVAGSNAVLQGNDILANHDLPPHPTNPSFDGCSNVGRISGVGLAIYDPGYVQIIGNTIEKNYTNDPNSNGATVNPGGGILLSGGNKVLLQGNIVRENVTQSASGLQTLYPTNQIVLIQNLFYGGKNPAGGASTQLEFLGAYGPTSLYPSIVEINNTIQGGSEHIVRYYGPSEIANNTFYGTLVVQNATQSTAGGFQCFTPGDANPAYLNVHHNDIFNNGVLVPSGCPPRPGNLTVDPQFLDPANFNFRTQPTSPVVAAGSINAPLIPAADLDGKAREVCGTIDMGAYEIRPRPAAVVTSSNNPSVGGTTVTFTAKVPGNCNVPTGKVTFLDGVTPIGTVALDTSASATLSTASLTVGSHNIIVTYPGDFNFDSSTSSAFVQVVTGYPTVTSLAVSPNPANAFQSISFSASVSAQFGTPSGTVRFFAGGTVLGTAPLNGSSGAALTLSNLGAGTYRITAVYTPTPDYASSTSPVVVEVVNGAPTTTSLTGAPDPAFFGQPVLFTAVVAEPQSTTTPTGTVSFRDGATTLGSATVGPTGLASFTTSTFPVGSHSVTAVYGGSLNDNGSTSNVVVEVVVQVPTAVTLTASPNPAIQGQVVTLTSTVSNGVAGLPSPSGTVTFSDQFGALGTATLANGVATFTTTSLAIGTHNITAVFAGGAAYSGSTSAGFAEVIKGFDFSLAVSSASLTIPAGGYQVLTVTLTPIGAYNRAVDLSCTTVPTNAQCVFTPSTSQPLSGNPQKIELVFNTSQVFEFGRKVGRLSSPDDRLYARSTPLFGFLLLPVFALCGRSRHLRGRLWFSSLLLAVLGTTFGLQGCSGKQPDSTAPGVYTVTISAKDTDLNSSIAHSIDMTIKVTK